MKPASRRPLRALASSAALLLLLLAAAGCMSSPEPETEREEVDGAKLAAVQAALALESVRGGSADGAYCLIESAPGTSMRGVPPARIRLPTRVLTGDRCPDQPGARGDATDGRPAVFVTAHRRDGGETEARYGVTIRPNPRGGWSLDCRVRREVDRWHPVDCEIAALH